MVHFRTLLIFARYLSNSDIDSSITIPFRKLLSTEFIVFTVLPQMEGWELIDRQYYATYDGTVWRWHSLDPPTDFTGNWLYQHEEKV